MRADVTDYPSLIYPGDFTNGTGVYSTVAITSSCNKLFTAAQNHSIE